MWHAQRVTPASAVAPLPRTWPNPLGSPSLLDSCTLSVGPTVSSSAQRRPHGDGGRCVIRHIATCSACICSSSIASHLARPDGLTLTLHGPAPSVLGLLCLDRVMLSNIMAANVRNAEVVSHSVALALGTVFVRAVLGLLCLDRVMLSDMIAADSGAKRDRRSTRHRLAGPTTPPLVHYGCILTLMLCCNC